ncbi:hypothetical protein K469DRAFT_702219 [Zopfia rhizophila CBS 207.26]|uniref:Uncharacterized protein n=1 Tax=Zopfia rhizophila CBS 207.26 TaxID=1314779 RepID=A0A6A6D7M7_9PEZI|nr:hypothetical protein K469DRAFT_702219 [Zopfia rhizophila CBS 207.26]
MDTRPPRSVPTICPHGSSAPNVSSKKLYPNSTVEPNACTGTPAQTLTSTTPLAAAKPKSIASRRGYFYFIASER